MRILILLLIMIGGQVQANNPDSLLTRWINGKKFLLHKVSPKETYSSLSRQYHVPVVEIQAANPKSMNLKIGEIINIPVLASSPTSTPTTSPSQAKNVADIQESPKAKTTTIASPATEGNSKQTHTVQKGETLYAISKMYGMSVDDVKKINGLNSNAVAIGQKLKVNALSKSVIPVLQETVKASTEIKTVNENEAKEIVVKSTPAIAPKEEVKESVKEPVKEVTSTPVIVESTKSTDTTELPKVYDNPGTSRTSVIEKDPKSGVEVEKVTEIGVATWLVEGDLNQNKFYALHRTAPVGSIIKVTNRMNNNSVFVKVVGTLPDTGDNNAAIIKITQAAAQRIGAIDQKFTAELSYGITR
ncbi:MAG: LysM peptidoglycan-binding domain-containing protein [Bacteroidetes bacterium]|nr:LysM peptidoglycan-binding domain-containing protein [Bacteroidota bacterium]